METHSTERGPATGRSSELFIRAIDPVAPDVPCRDVHGRFLGDPELQAVPVCDGGRPVGIVERFQFLSRFAHSFGHAMFARRPVRDLMEHDPIVVEHDATVVAIKSRISTALPGAGARGFVVTREGNYVGMGSVVGLLRASLLESEKTNARLAEALEQSEREGALKSKFLANLSHEFRTPLNAIIGFSDVMVREIAGPLNANYRDYANDILSSGQHMLALINDLLDLAKIESGEMRPSPEAVDVGPAIDTALRGLRETAAKAGLEIACEIAPDTPPFLADPLHVRQILVNLLSNAIKFTPRGRVTVCAAAADRGVEIAIADTGIGMTIKETEIALRPFGQVANHLTRTHEGPGLGLPLVKALAAINGATFRIASEPGKGTRVSMRFPPVPAEGGPSTPTGLVG
jgi:two-component system cell cycle sensor histidine kinase PleC